MNKINKLPVGKLGYDFIPPAYIPKGQDEYYIRRKQNAKIFGGDKKYRHLTAGEIETLVQNNNTSDDWNKLWVTEAFDPDLVIGCHFFGLVRIGKLEPLYLGFHNLRLAVGLYDSTIVSCDFGDNVVINNVNFMAHYIVDNESIILNVNELSVSPHTKFGNGILKEGEDEAVRIWLEICNENGGRKVLPFEGMLPGDAFLWSKFRGDEALLDKFVEFTEHKFDRQRGHYGVIGKRCVVKYCKTIKDVYIGDDAYIKGANKLKNLTINSSPEESTQIGEGCELVNGIIGYGCRIFYGVKAVRFIMDAHSNLKYGARLINAYLGSNATISCCEVLNSLIFPTHEQHHNNSFLCASLVMGQSNLAAGTTIGSNHNSRRADGEIVAGRGFWPGLSVNLKHNSRFASFLLIAQGYYPSEIDLPFPFALLNNNASADKLEIMPGYWILYNMYALARNAEKYVDRDKRSEKIHHIEYDYLAPDTAEEMLAALGLMEKFVGKAVVRSEAKDNSEMSVDELRERGKKVLSEDPEQVKGMKIRADGIENSRREVELLKVDKAYAVYQKMICFYGIREILFAYEQGRLNGFQQLADLFKVAERSEWLNVGGQLIREKEVEKIKTAIKQGELESWDDVHKKYVELGETYREQKFIHALAALKVLKDLQKNGLTQTYLKAWVDEFMATADWIKNQVEATRKKDYKNNYRRMVYHSDAEMENVVGKLSDDNFIRHTRSKMQNEKDLAQRFIDDFS